MTLTPKFIFAVCQIGAEPALKAEVARNWPEYRFAYSRPGFVTFKVDENHPPSTGFDLRSVFARTYGISLGKVTGVDHAALAEQVWQLANGIPVQHLHVWRRDSTAAGERGFDPRPPASCLEIGELILQNRPNTDGEQRRVGLNEVAQAEQTVLDCVLVEPNEWWIGTHRASSISSRWPGGVPPIELPEHAVSRAYLKMAEALRWSKLPIAVGDHCIEIGSAPGGAAQCLLDEGLHVMGIDPAEVSPAVVEHPNFTHVRKRGSEVKRREFRDAKWLVADSNVAPNHTLDTLEAIVTYPDVYVRGMLLTLKLLDWKLTEEIPGYMARVRSWGYDYVKARQLAFNRQEICVMALQRRSFRRFIRKR